MASTRRGGESSSSGRTTGVGFGAGAKVEVRSNDEGFRGAWYEATVVRSLPRRRYSVQYVSLVSDGDPSEPLHEVVRRSHVRPQPPPPPSPTRYQVFQRVEVFHNDGWWAGVVSKLHGEDSGRFTVSFPITREVMDFPPSEIRPLLEWVRGQWIVARDQEVAEPLFSVGEQVEVSHERENYGAAWFAATIGSVISKSIFLVDYKTLRSDANKEIVDAQYIRPVPPLASEDENFGLHDVVEALYEGGWLLGVVSEILNGSKYIVKLKHHEEEMEFNHSEMRSCQVWEDGQWIGYSSEDKDRKSPMLGGTRSAGPQRKTYAGKRSSLPISVSTSSDDDDDVRCVPLSGVLRLKCKLTEGLGTGVQMSLSHPCRNLKRGKLFDYKLPSQDCFSSKSPLGLEAESQVAKPLLEDSLSSLDVLQHLVSTSPEKIATKVLRNPSSMELNCGQNVTEMNDVTKSLTGRNKPSDFTYKGSEHQSKASVFNHSPVNDEAGEFLPITEWGSCEGSCGPREGSMKRIKKLAIRAPHRQKKSPEVVSIKQFSQERERRKRGSPPKRSIEPEQAEDLPDEVAEEEHVRQEVEQSNQGQSGDASVETPAHGHHDGAMGHKDHPPLLVNMPDSPTSNAVSICQTDQHMDVLEDRQTMPQIKLLIPVDTLMKVSTTQQSPFMLASSFRMRLDEILTFDSQHDKAATEAEEGALVCVSKKDNAASCEGLNPSESPSKRTDENKEALIDPSASHSSSKEVILPFLKSSSMWKSIEAMDIFHIMPQQPHFRPLEQYTMEFREGMGIGLMVSFANMAANIHKLNIADNRSIFEERLKALGPLEANGFDVGRLRACLEELLETQSNQRQSESKKAELQRKIIERKSENDRLDALAVQLGRAIMEVEQNLTHMRESRELVIMQRKINETEISKLRKDVQEAEEAYRSAERHFNTTVVAPW